MTGRGAGFCAGYNMPGFGFGRGFAGGGRGRRNRFYATGVSGWMAMEYPHWGGNMPYPAYGPNVQPGMSREHELDALRDQAAFLDENLGNVKKRIDELEAEAAKEKK